MLSHLFSYHHSITTDIGTGQTEVTDNDSQDSDSNYQTSIDDSDVENTRTRDKRTAT